MADEEVKGEEVAQDNPVPTAEEKAEMMEDLLAKMRLLQDAQVQIQAARDSIGAQFAEVGNSDKMVYTDRETGKVQKWGISKAVFDKHAAIATAALDNVALIVANFWKK